MIGTKVLPQPLHIPTGVGVDTGPQSGIARHCPVSRAEMDIKIVIVTRRTIRIVPFGCSSTSIIKLASHDHMEVLSIDDHHERHMRASYSLLPFRRCLDLRWDIIDRSQKNLLEACAAVSDLFRRDAGCGLLTLSLRMRSLSRRLNA